MTVASTSRRTFAALKVPNYRRYFTGQAISLVGTWMQTTAQAWLVLTLTHSATDLGFIIALQTLPILLLGPYGGVVADRVDKRKLMVVLQSMMGVQALALGVLVLVGHVRFWEIGVLAVVLGLNNCFENPSRQAFVLEMVGADQLRNAVSLNSTLVNAARAVGPAVAGIMIATVGVGWCFLINALSFVAVVYSLVSMDRSALSPSPTAPRAKRQLRAGFDYVRRTPSLGIPLVMMALVGTMAYEFQVTLPYAAEHVFHGGARAFGFMTASMGVGAVVGGLITATRGKTGLRPLIGAALGFGVAIGLASVAPNLVTELLALLLVGFGSVSFLAMANSTLQLGAAPEMRGRVMALWAVAFLGTTPVGGPLVGWISASSGGRFGLVAGAVSCAAAAGVGAVALRRLNRSRAPNPGSAISGSKDARGEPRSAVA